MTGEPASNSGTGESAPPGRSPAERMRVGILESQVIAVLETVYDPEIPVNIYAMGLIYEVNVKPTGDVHIVMTLTSPQCPVAETLPVEVRTRTEEIEGVNEAKVDIVWEPPWTPERMSEAARLELGLD